LSAASLAFAANLYPRFSPLPYPDVAFPDGGAWVATGLTSGKGGVSDLACARWRRSGMAAELWLRLQASRVRPRPLLRPCGPGNIEGQQNVGGARQSGIV